MEGKFVSYYRVSTRRQGASGLGLEAQKTAVAQYLAQYVNSGLLGEFTEIESGKDDQNRPKLQEALTLCKLTGARLIVATLDRLSRDVEFLAKLQKSSVASFLCADMPDASELQVGLMAVLAQDERRRISTRVKKALAEAKKRGTKRDGTPFRTATAKLGPTPAGIEAIKVNGARGRKLAIASLKRKANVFAQDLAPMMARLQAEGFTTQAALAQELNRRGIRTPRGLVGHWTQAGAGRLLRRVKAVLRRRASDQTVTGTEDMGLTATVQRVREEVSRAG